MFASLWFCICNAEMQYRVDGCVSAIGRLLRDASVQCAIVTVKPPRGTGVPLSAFAPPLSIHFISEFAQHKFCSRKYLIRESCIVLNEHNAVLASNRCYMQQVVHWAHPSPECKRYFDRFRILCRAHYVTNRQTTLLGRSQ